MIDNIVLKDIDLNEFKEKIYPYYYEIFPEDERKPFKMIEIIYNKGYTRIIEILNKDVIIGFMILNRVKQNSYAILDYFAIFSEYRNKGYGTEAFKLLLEQEKNNDGIFIECDKEGLGQTKEENIFRKKRNNFYKRLGLTKLNFDLNLFDVIYTPYVFSNIKINEDLILKEIFDIYNETIGKERVAQRIRVIKGLKFEKLTKENLKLAAKIQYEIFPGSSAYSVYKSAVTGERKSFYVSYIAYYENNPVGVIGLYEIPEYRDTVWLSWFGLLKEYRKMGFGKQMLDFICEVAKENNKKYLRLYTFEVWNSTAQKFYNDNMDMGETYYNEEESVKEIYEGKPKIFSKSLCGKQVEPWNNKFIDISEDEDSHEKSILMMKEDGVIN